MKDKEHANKIQILNKILKLERQAKSLYNTNFTQYAKKVDSIRKNEQELLQYLQQKYELQLILQAFTQKKEENNEIQVIEIVQK